MENTRLENAAPKHKGVNARLEHMAPYCKGGKCGIALQGVENVRLETWEWQSMESLMKLNDEDNV